MKVSYEQYHAFSAPLEGRVPTMYCDCLGLITTGVGNLINTEWQAKALPWKLADGSMADTADVMADWQKLAAGRAYYAARKWTVYAKTMRCHLDDAAIDALCQKQLAANEATYRKRWPHFDEFPADAQLAIHSMGWAVGAAFYQKFPNLSACIDRQDWEGCVASCKIREDGNPGVVPRNAKNRFCFHNASLAAKSGGCIPVDTLYWPLVAAETQTCGDSPARMAADAARIEADLSQAAWAAHELSRSAIVPGAGAALKEYESNS